MHELARLDIGELPTKRKLLATAAVSPAILAADNVTECTHPVRALVAIVPEKTEDAVIDKDPADLAGRFVRVEPVPRLSYQHRANGRIGNWDVLRGPGKHAVPQPGLGDQAHLLVGFDRDDLVPKPNCNTG